MRKHECLYDDAELFICGLLKIVSVFFTITKIEFPWKHQPVTSVYIITSNSYYVVFATSNSNARSRETRFNRQKCSNFDKCPKFSCIKRKQLFYFLRYYEEYRQPSPEAKIDKQEVLRDSYEKLSFERIIGC